MAHPVASVRTYGRRTRVLATAQAGAALTPLQNRDPNSSLKPPRDADLDIVADQLAKINLDGIEKPKRRTRKIALDSPAPKPAYRHDTPRKPIPHSPLKRSGAFARRAPDKQLRVLSWQDVCSVGDKIEKIAEASFAEVYRITNDRGTSVIKVVRLESPIKAQTKAQQKSRLVDEEPRCESDLQGELQISEWLADIPGFVVYKERYLVQGETTPALLETHQTFQRRAKRQDPGRLQYYPSPSRYLDQTKFLVVELGDAGTSLEDLDLHSTDQLWDIFLHTAIALGRAEEHTMFEHRDLHEGNLCVRQALPMAPKKDKSECVFGYSGLEITILDYGLSRAQDTQQCTSPPIAYDLERDLSLFTSTHAPQCRVYRRMRSFLLEGDRVHLPPEMHCIPYDDGISGPINWDTYISYSNVLWLAYIYSYLLKAFRGPKTELELFRGASCELWVHLDPDAAPEVLSFACAADVVGFCVEAGWITEDQLMGARGDGQSFYQEEGGPNTSIIDVPTSNSAERRSPRKHDRS